MLQLGGKFPTSRLDSRNLDTISQLVCDLPLRISLIIVSLVNNKSNNGKGLMEGEAGHIHLG